DSHKISKAIEHYTRSAQLLPHVPTIFCNLVYTKLFACDWRGYDEDFARLMRMVEAETALTFRGWYDEDFARLMRMVEAETAPDQPPPRHLCAVLYRPLSAELMRRVATTYTRKLLMNL
ncbi:hypothetical protein T484DRAFT_1810475, partial [Baffinella frigidus]